jgi:hypothetical protein
MHYTKPTIVNTLLANATIQQQHQGAGTIKNDSVFFDQVNQACTVGAYEADE